LDWLVDHKGDFTLAAQETCGSNVQIDWSRPRLILIAESFSDYDKYAVNRIGANIELWTYRRYGDDLLYLDPLFVASTQPSKVVKPKKEKEDVGAEVEEPIPVYTLEDHPTNRSPAIRDLLELLRERIFALAEEGEIIEKANKMYIGYKHGKNFCEVRVQASGLKLWLDISPFELDDPYNLGRDVSKLGHYGTGNVELKLANPSELNKIMPLIEQSYQQTI
jgi:predicted transport protein